MALARDVFRRTLKPRCVAARAAAAAALERREGIRTAGSRRPGEKWARPNPVRRYEPVADRAADAALNREHWDGIGAAYTSEWAPPARARLGERELEFILAGLRRSPATAALDVGIGSGRILDGLLRGTRATEFWGLDIADAMVDATRARFAGEPRIRELRVCDVSREPLPFERAFDFVSAIRMLKYNENWDEMVAKLVATLSPGGVIVFSVSNARSLNIISRPYAIAGFEVSREQARAVCDRLGLEILDEQGFTKLPHVIYSRARSPRAAGAALGADALLARVFGGPTLAREVFFVARRR